MRREYWILAVIVLLGLFVAWQQGLLPTTFLAEDCRNVYCNEFNYICCGEDILNPQYKTVTGAGQCPTTATKCSASGHIENYEYAFEGYTSCEYKQNILGVWHWECTGALGSRGDSIEVQPGQWIKARIDTFQFSMKITQTKLFDCGKSACIYSGIPLTTSGCVWVTDKRIYDSSTGGLIKEAVAGQNQEYTIPKGICYLYTTGNLRRVCGDTCEACDSDSDCITGHTYQYDGKGAECQSGQLLLYGCRHYDSVCLERDCTGGYDPVTGVCLGEKCAGDYAANDRCELIETRAIECCPQSDFCGPNAFCDPQTFTCKSSGQVECSQDWECGQATVCDYTEKKLKKPVCSLNKCAFQVLQSVECCYDVNCPTNYFCGSDYKCYEQTQQRTTCPYECCVRDAAYFDKLCPEGKQCVDHKCVGQTDGVVDEKMWAYIFAGIAGTLSFLMVGKKAIKTRDEVDMAIAGIIAFIIALVVWWAVSNWKAIMISLGIFTLLGGLALYFFGGVILFIVIIAMQIIRTIRGD